MTKQQTIILNESGFDTGMTFGEYWPRAMMYGLPVWQYRPGNGN